MNARHTGSESSRELDGVMISDLYYVAYNSNGTKVSYIHQDTLNSSNFGVISDSLAAGNYTIFVIASGKPMYVEYVKMPGNTSINVAKIGPFLYGIGVEPMGDAFYKKLQIEITPSSNVPLMELSLNRIVGKLEVHVLDALPATHANGLVRVQVTPLTTFFNLNDSTVTSPDPVWEWFGKRIDQTSFVNYLLGSTNEFNVKIYYKNKTTGENLVKTIEHVTCLTNKKTVLKGYLYGPYDHSGGPDYEVQLNQSWNSDSTLINF